MGLLIGFWEGFFGHGTESVRNGFCMIILGLYWWMGDTALSAIAFSDKALKGTKDQTEYTITIKLAGKRRPSR